MNIHAPSVLPFLHSMLNVLDERSCGKTVHLTSYVVSEYILQVLVDQKIPDPCAVHSYQIYEGLRKEKSGTYHASQMGTELLNKLQKL